MDVRKIGTELTYDLEPKISGGKIPVKAQNFFEIALLAEVQVEMEISIRNFETAKIRQFPMVVIALLLTALPHAAQPLHLIESQMMLELENEPPRQRELEEVVGARNAVFQWALMTHHVTFMPLMEGPSATSVGE